MTDCPAQVTLGERIPWPDDESYANIPADEALDLYLDWVADQAIEPWDHQLEALLDLAAGNHVILGTPTGSGKSLVALGLCFLAVCTDRRAYYTAPIKALVSEKFFALCDVLGKDNVGMITGDVVINAQAPIICCTAEILAQDALRFGMQADIGCVVMDEFHYYGDSDRGWAWQVPLLTLPHTQFLLMSATLGDVNAITQALEKHTGRAVDLVLTAPRPVPLSYEFVETPLEATVELALRDGDAPLYIVHFSQEAAVKSAQALASYGVSTKEQRDQIKDALKGARFNTAFGKTLKRLLLTGVGVHHAGMLPRYRLLVERLAQQGTCPYTPCCSHNSPNLMAIVCDGLTHENSIRLLDVQGGLALIQRVALLLRQMNMTLSVHVRFLRQLEIPRRSARLNLKHHRTTLSAGTTKPLNGSLQLHQSLFAHTSKLPTP